jgi:hypothetical protein
MDPQHKTNPHYKIPSTMSVTSSMSSGSYVPMTEASAGQKRTRSKQDPNTNANLRSVYGLNLGMLRQWQQEKNEKLLDSENSKQAIAVAKVRGFLDAVGKRYLYNGAFAERLLFCCCHLGILFLIFTWNLYNNCRLNGENPVLVPNVKAIPSI